jgi:hypothetical protein
MSYQWYRDQVELTGATNSELSIANVSLADAGSYTVEISSALERKVSPAAIVTVTEDPGPGTSDCTLTLSSASGNSLKITGEAPANANYELQHTDSLTSPNWQRIQNVTTRTDGTFEVTIQTSLGSGFIRTIRR